MDTVQPIGTLARLPFRIDGDRAWGPGAEDMKGGAYIALAAIRTLIRRGERPPGPVRHLITSDEEMGSPTSRDRIEAEARRAHHVLVTEPARSGGKIVIARKGVGQFRIGVRGRAAHAGVEHELGRSAIRELARQVLEIEAMTDYARGLTLNVGRIEGGTRPNVVPEAAFALVDVRTPNLQAGEEITARLKALKPFDPDVELTVEGAVDRPGYDTTPDLAALFEHARKIAAEIGFELEGLKTGGGSDGNFTAAIAPTLDGLGVDGDGGHTPQERLYIASVIPRTQLLMGLLMTLRP
jgi:glutamate carboxypeptidase